MLVKSILNLNIILVKVNISLSSNNTIICVSTLNDKVLFCSSNGSLKVKGAKRSTSYASQRISNILGKKLHFLGYKYIYIVIKGFGNGRYTSIKGFDSTGLITLNILDKTFIPFNGCKVSKKRRI